MTKTKYYDEEDRPLLVLAVDPGKFRIPDAVCEAAVTRGAVNYLGQWPAHLLTAFIAGCLIVATFVLFGLITAILIMPISEKCRIPRNVDANYLPNVYFIKHENRTWNPRELCYIETTARTYGNLSIYLINLLEGEESGGNLGKLVFKLPKTKSRANENREPISLEIFDGDDDKSVKMRWETPERRSREKLEGFNGNIKNVDVSVRRFFNGSRLAKVSNHLSKDMIEIAAKAYVLWNFPGVALDPDMYPSLEFLGEYLCKKDEDGNGCEKNGIAAIELDGGIQASSIPCQSFLDYLIRQISLNGLPDRKYVLKKAISDYCPRSSRCQGVKLLDHIPRTAGFSKEKLNCPSIIDANGAKENFEKMQATYIKSGERNERESKL